jgi:hypothetical protein
MGEQTHVPSSHQGSMNRAADEHVIGRLGQARL